MPFFRAFPGPPRASFFAALGLLLLFPAPEGVLLGGEPAPEIPLIRRLEGRDPVFRQYAGDVEEARRRLFDRRREGGSLLDWLSVYSWAPSGEDIFALAARCNVPYSSIATLNRLSHPPDMAAGGLILLPTMPGLFIPQEPETDLERLLAGSRDPAGGIPLTLRRDGRSEGFLFYPGGDFSPTERVFFLAEGFRFPLRSYRVTSVFGPRRNPVTGALGNHRGLDLAAPEGAEVHASRDGTVVEAGEDPVYGNYVVLRHGDGWASLYGHLSRITTDLRRSVRSGTVIGRVGSTGQSTGPHLHFEIRQYGRAQDPGKLLFKEGQP